MLQFFFAHVLIGEPVSTSPEHALDLRTVSHIAAKAVTLCGLPQRAASSARTHHRIV